MQFVISEVFYLKWFYKKKERIRKVVVTNNILSMLHFSARSWLLILEAPYNKV